MGGEQQSCGMMGGGAEQQSGRMGGGGAVAETGGKVGGNCSINTIGSGRIRSNDNIGRGFSYFHSAHGIKPGIYKWYGNCKINAKYGSGLIQLHQHQHQHL